MKGSKEGGNAMKEENMKEMIHRWLSICFFTN
jgi:hypothetical protein